MIQKNSKDRHNETHSVPFPNNCIHLTILILYEEKQANHKTFFKNNCFS